MAVAAKSNLPFVLALLLVAGMVGNTRAGNIAVYWGQNGNEGTLAEACNSGNYNYVILAFLSTFGNGQTPQLNIAGHSMDGVNADIKACQSQNIKVLLSLGGGSGGYGLSSSDEANSLANYLWDNFLGGSSSTRPLGDSVLDGIDFDIETGNPAHYDELASALKAKGNVMLTAAPQCPYPDASLGPALQAVQFDIVWVHFYNNPPCQYANGDASNLVNAWNTWTSSVNAGSFYLGLPASTDAAGSGYIEPSDLTGKVIPAINSGKFGGIMLYYDVLNGYSAKLLADPPIGSPIPGASGSPPPIDSPIASNAGSLPKKSIRIYIIAGTSSLFGLCIILLTFFLWYKKYYGVMPWQRGSRNAPRIESFLQKQGTAHPKRYTYSEVKRMTKSFAHKLGQGGYGAVYRGNLSDGREIAVKMLKDTEGNGEDFMNEVASISKTSHVNVVTLIGFFLQGSKRGLIYEYMSNVSLDKYTFGSNSTKANNTLSWDKLFDIIVGIAQGLEYLHTGCNTRIVHFDIKPQNILLDQDFCPKISDFGLAKLCRQKESKVSIAGARGTIGYIAPEVVYRNDGAVSTKFDVYSYGMVILEMVGARKQIEVSTDSSSKYFPQWLYDNLDQFCGRATTCEISSETTELVRKMTIVGLWCIQLSPDDRPSMSKVLEMLEGSTVDLQMPPKAFYVG